MKEMEYLLASVPASGDDGHAADFEDYRKTQLVQLYLEMSGG
jgi:hypothetical protein